MAPYMPYFKRHYLDGVNLGVPEGSHVEASFTRPLSPVLQLPVFDALCPHAKWLDLLKMTNKCTF